MATNSAPLGRMPKNIRRKIMEPPEYKTATTRNMARSREWDGGNSALPVMPKPPSPRSGKALAAENHLVLADSNQVILVVEPTAPSPLNPRKSTEEMSSPSEAMYPN